MPRLALLLLLSAWSTGVTADVLDRVDALLAEGKPDSARVLLEGADPMPATNRLRVLRGRLSNLDLEAKKQFRAATLTGGSLAEDAHFELAESAYTDPRGLYRTARETYRSLIETYPGSRHVPLALYRIGRTYQITANSEANGRTQIDSARVAFREVMRRFPESSVARFAAVALLEADDLAGSREAVSAARASLPPTPLWEGHTALYERFGLPHKQTPSESKAFWVQVGAFTNRKAIDALVTRLEPIAPSVRKVSSGRLTLIQAGPFSTRDEADRLNRRISQSLAPDSYVVQD